MNISIVGTGYVGLVSGACFAEMGIDVTCVDIDEKKIGRLLSGEVPIYEPGLDDLVRRNVEAGRLHFTTDLSSCLDQVEVVFSAVGTPPDEDGSADLRYVLEVARTFGRNINKYTILVTKSTVPVGTSKKVKAVIQEELDRRGVQIPFEVASNPEFLKEGRRSRISCRPTGSSSVRSRACAAALVEIVQALSGQQFPDLFHGYSFGRDDQICSQCDAGDANLLHERHRESLRQGRSRHRYGSEGDRNGRAHRQQIPLCRLRVRRVVLSKDVRALARTGRRYGSPMRIIEAVEAVNERQKEIVVRKLASELGDLRGRTVALWGLAFKPETDDMREAPALVAIDRLTRAGAAVRVYDPAAMDECRRRVGDAVVYCSDMYEAVVDADALVLLTEWKQFRLPSWTVIRKVMANPLVIDGRNIYDKAELVAEGFTYKAIGK